MYATPSEVEFEEVAVGPRTVLLLLLLRIGSEVRDMQYPGQRLRAFGAYHAQSLRMASMAINRPTQENL